MNLPSCQSEFTRQNTESKTDDYDRFKENSIQFQIQQYLITSQKFQSQDKNKSTLTQKKQNIQQEHLDFSCFQALYSQACSKNQLKLPKFKLDFAKKSCFENKIYDNFYQSEDVMQDCTKCKKLLNMRYILKEFSQYQLFRANKIEKYMFLRRNQTQLSDHEVKDQKKSEETAQQPQKSLQIQQVVQNVQDNIEYQQNGQNIAKKDIKKILQMDIEDFQKQKDLSQQQKATQNENKNLKIDFNSMLQSYSQQKLDKVEQLNQIKDKNQDLNQNIQKQTKSQQMEVEFCSKEENLLKKIPQKQKQEINQNQKIFQSLALQVYFSRFYTNQNNFTDQMEIERVSSKQKKKNTNIFEDYKELIINLLKNTFEQNQKQCNSKKVKFELIFRQNKKEDKLQLFDQLKDYLLKNYQRRTNSLFKSDQDQNLQTESNDYQDLDFSRKQSQNKLPLLQSKMDFYQGKSKDINFEWLEDQRYQLTLQNKDKSQYTKKRDFDQQNSIWQQQNTPSVSQSKNLKQRSIDDFFNNTSRDKISQDIQGSIKQYNNSIIQKEKKKDAEKYLFDQKNKNSQQENVKNLKIKKDEQSKVFEDSINQQYILESFQIDETTTNKKQLENQDFFYDRPIYKVRDYIIDENTLIQKQNDSSITLNLKQNVYDYHDQNIIQDNQNNSVQKSLNYDQYSEVSFSKLSQSSKKNLFTDLQEQPQNLKKQNNIFNFEKILCTNQREQQRKQISETNVDISKIQNENNQSNEIQNATSSIYSQFIQSQFQQQNQVEIPSKKLYEVISQRFENRESDNRNYLNNFDKQKQNYFDDSLNQEKENPKSIQLKSKISKKALKIKTYQQKSSNTFNTKNLSEQIKKRMHIQQKNNFHLRQDQTQVQNSIGKSQNTSEVQKSDQQEGNQSFQLVKFINSFKQNKFNQN
ncbi:hypothetical protein TTHERM_00431390 (macronuclear) [Tetrahymena thermophila SB210]|uniref:Uncharacterized protein n=1 Tax=Tetrahymena thermophila (strain SB210) TaxID=312017 RepID=Q231C0_TETTS|nr:hypothetical protein TTHERM_00431390 [Tetrahymena thermophila SB210]EAR91119.2 hypothetical protein TTHERM_00431390 [Tetrahymena thermophila SB210]|eukprot:XP_001011364.2 hypothetical protein TTHERM_00431390 [Tetrahymena thermophila SB210]